MTIHAFDDGGAINAYAREPACDDVRLMHIGPSDAAGPSPSCLQSSMKLNRAHAYMVVPGILAGGILLGLVAEWSWLAVCTGALLGGIAAPAGVAISQWMLAELTSKPYQP
jgi:hypothetical protein